MLMKCENNAKIMILIIKSRAEESVSSQSIFLRLAPHLVHPPSLPSSNNSKIVLSSNRNSCKDTKHSRHQYLISNHIL